MVFFRSFYIVNSMIKAKMYSFLTKIDKIPDFKMIKEALSYFKQYLNEIENCDSINIDLNSIILLINKIIANIPS